MRAQRQRAKGEAGILVAALESHVEGLVEFEDLIEH